LKWDNVKNWENTDKFNIKTTELNDFMEKTRLEGVMEENIKKTESAELGKLRLFFLHSTGCQLKMAPYVSPERASAEMGWPRWLGIQKDRFE